MLAECGPTLFEFAPVEGRAVVAGFDGGAIISNAGALPLGATDRAVGSVRRFAACFRDARAPERIEHEVATLVGRRVSGIALGHEDVVDHDQLRHDPVPAALTGKPEARRPCRRERLEAARARAGGRARGVSPHRPRQRGDRGAVRRPVPGGPPLGAAADHPRPGCDRRAAAWASGRPLPSRLPRGPPPPAAPHLPRPAPAGGEAAAGQHQCLGRRPGGGRAHHPLDPRPPAAGSHPAPGGFRFRPRAADGLGRGEPGGPRLRPRPRAAPGRGTRH